MTRAVKPGDAYLITGSQAPVVAVAHLLEGDRDGAREVLLALGLIEPVNPRPTPVKKPHTTAKPTPPPPRVLWRLLPNGRQLHAVREGHGRTVCGCILGQANDWRIPTPEQLADGPRCLGCMSAKYVRRAA